MEEGEEQEGSAGFEFDDKDDEEVEDLSRESMGQNVEQQLVECNSQPGM